MSRSFLQTEEWLKFQEFAGNKSWRFSDEKITANIIKLGLPMGKSMLYVPHGPEIQFDDIGGGLKNELSNFIKYLKDLAKEERAIFIKIEPLSDIVIELMYRRGFQRSSKQIQPYKTVVLDLNLPEEHLLGKMHPKTRYNINLSERKGLILEEGGDLEMFWKLLKKTAKEDQFSTHSREYYEKLLGFFSAKGGSVSGGKDGKDLQTKLFFVKFEGKPIGAAIIMIYHNNAYYLHGAMDREYKSLMAPYFMHWEVIKILKSSGLKYYDFWGVDARKWPGVTRFKLGWLGSPKSDEGGGGLVEYHGSFDLPVSKFWYLAYSLIRKIKK
ncbi:MAG: peptidoglycan bridge formation glycyltransferase FemA/FemB family protein [Candidatus Yanofskybacteria bacterium]|nr:peptidoglycan bridge formation glycyltransferase FemA/FemB family protein [Candidatus Yanofskybacteria bacterium]